MPNRSDKRKRRTFAPCFKQRLQHGHCVERPEIFERATTASKDGRFKPFRLRCGVRRPNGPRNRLGCLLTLHGNWNQHQRNTRPKLPRRLFNVVPNRTSFTRQHCDPPWEGGKRKLVGVVEPPLVLEILPHLFKPLVQRTLPDPLKPRENQREFAKRRVVLKVPLSDDLHALFRLEIHSARPTTLPEKRAIDLVGVGVFEREVQVFIRLRGPKLPDLPANPEWLTVVDRSKCGVDLLAHFSNRERSSRFGEQFIHATYDTVAPMTKTPQPSLTDSIDVIAGVGPRMAKAFETLGLSTIEDLLWHVPVRYELDRAGSSINEVEEIVGHETDAAENISVIGTLAAIRTTPGRSPRIEATLDDGTGTIRLIWFNAGWMRRKLRPGMMLSAEGRASRFKGYLQLTNPSWTILNDDEPFEERSEGFRPIYPATEELPSRKIATVLESVLDHATALIAEPLPEALRTHHALPPLGRAFRMVHLPNDLDEVETARRRLAFDELLLLQLGVMLKRQHLRSSLSAPPFALSDAIHKRIIKRFPFELTTDQASACSEIARDLGSTIPMNRLLQGDVGAGKTVVALSGMLLAAQN